MAIISAQRKEPNAKVSRVIWENIQQNDTCEEIDWNGAGDRTVQVTGTWNGADISIVGTLGERGGVYSQLTDPFGNNINFTDNGIDTVTEVTRFIKPLINGGDGSTNLTVIMLFRKTN